MCLAAHAVGRKRADLSQPLPVEPREQQQQQQQQQGRKRCIFRISALVLLFVGVAASAVAVTQLQGNHKAKVSKERFASTLDYLDRVMERLQVTDSLLSASAQFVAIIGPDAEVAGGSMTYQMYLDFESRLANNNPGIIGVAFMPKVAHADRDAYTALGRSIYGPEYDIIERPDTMQIDSVPRPTAEFYLPVLYIYPAIPVALGIDMATHVAFKPAWDQAVATQKRVLSAPFPLHLLDDTRGFWLIQPIVREGSVNEVVFLLLDAHQLFDYSLHSTTQLQRILVFDANDPDPATGVIYDSAGLNSDRPKEKEGVVLRSVLEVEDFLDVEVFFIFKEIAPSIINWVLFAALVMVAVMLFMLVMAMDRQMAAERCAKQYEILAFGAKQKENTIRTIVSNVSHDIRTPMNGILGACQLLRDTIDPTTNGSKLQEEYVNVMEASGHIMLSLVNDILSFGQIEAGAMSLSPGVLRLSSCLDQAIQVTSIRAKEKGITLRRKVAKECPKFVTLDHFRLSQILLNLIGNALKFTPRGGTVSLSMDLASKDKERHTEEDNCTIMVAVADTGVGIDPENTLTLFDPFQQYLEQEHCTRPQGVGLGLAICKHLVGLMGGEIWCESIKGKGSTFLFTLVAPVAEAEDGDEEKRSISNSTSGWESILAAFVAPAEYVPEDALRSVELVTKEPHSETEGKEEFDKRVLVVDDNRVNRLILGRMLKAEGYQVFEAEDGQAALGVSRKEHRFPVVFMDVQMPVMGGLECTQQLRLDEMEAPGVSRARIIGTSASCSEEDMARCIASGMDGFLSKPINKKNLRNVLQPLPD